MPGLWVTNQPCWHWGSWEGRVCPLGAGLGPAPHFTGVTQELMAANNFQPLQTCAMAEPVTHCLQPKAQQLLPAPFGTPLKSSRSFLNAHFVLYCTRHWNAALVGCLFLFFFSSLSQGTVIPALPWAQTLRRQNGFERLRLTCAAAGQGATAFAVQPCKSFPSAPSPCPLQPNNRGDTAVPGEHPKGGANSPWCGSDKLLPAAECN